MVGALPTLHYAAHCISSSDDFEIEICLRAQKLFVYVYIYVLTICYLFIRARLDRPLCATQLVCHQINA